MRQWLAIAKDAITKGRHRKMIAKKIAKKARLRLELGLGLDVHSFVIPYDSFAIVILCENILQWRTVVMVTLLR